MLKTSCQLAQSYFHLCECYDMFLRPLSLLETPLLEVQVDGKPVSVPSSEVD